MDQRGGVIEGAGGGGARVDAAGPPWTLLGLVAASLASLVVAVMVTTRPERRVDEAGIDRLVAAGRFADAEAALADHLARSPGDARAHYLMAQVLVDRTDVPADSTDRAMARRALEHAEHAATLDPAGELVPPALAWLYRGKALYQLKRWDAAERAWRTALRIDPAVPEAGWSLIGLYDLAGRRDEARRLALRLFEVEPDARDRARLLLELLREDTAPVSAESVVPLFEEAVAEEPDALRPTLALGLSLVRAGDSARGMTLLREATARHPREVEAWAALLGGLDRAARPDELGAALSEVPESLRHAPELARYRGLVAQAEGRWADAVRELRVAVECDPTDFDSRVRLERALRFAGEAVEAAAWAERVSRHREARQGLLALYDQALATAGLGVRPHVVLCERLAAAREAMGRDDEAALWRIVGRGVGR